MKEDGEVRASEGDGLIRKDEEEPSNLEKFISKFEEDGEGG